MSNKKRVFDLEDDFFKSLAKEIGGDVLDEIGKCKQFIDTGILSLNFIVSGKFVGGGIPTGACIEISGGSSSGKSLIGCNLMRGCQTIGGVPVFLDAERTLSKEFAIKASRVDPKRIVVAYGDTLEKCFNQIFNVIRKIREEWEVPLEKPIVIIYDSIAVSPSGREFAETELDMETASKTQIKEAGAGADKPGERAKICGKELRKLTPYLEQHNASVVFINQFRNKIGVMFGDPRTEAGGGMALPYWCSSRLQMSSHKKIKDQNGMIIGLNVSCKNTKNKVSKPFGEANNVRLFFDKGCDPLGGLLGLLLQCGRVSGKGGNYKVLEPYANGEEVKFKSSEERNDVPAEVLLKCPSLVDATDVSQIKYYLEMFSSAIDAVNQDIGSEESFAEGEE